MPQLVVTFEASSDARAVIERTVANAGEVVYLADQAKIDRHNVLSQACVLLSRNTAKELCDGEVQVLTNARLIQYVSAGIDFIPLKQFPPTIGIAGNGGGYAEPMAEHALMMTLAAYKRLLIEHRKLEAGDFDQFRPNRMLAGAVCGVLGFGGIGKATAHLMRCMGMKVHAINRSGTTDEAIDWIGREGDLAQLLKNADILVLSLPLTPATDGMIGPTELEAMKKDAVLINLARGEIVDEGALFAHLQQTPSFTACIDAWWIEPVRHGEFRMDHDFMTLPNVIASPHNSASVSGWRNTALQRAVENACIALGGATPHFLVPAEDRMM
ncbi:MAG: 2-hydroxyacid dehydrogenase [Hyphomicrobiaceae bacterium]